MKKLLALLLAVVMVFAMVACAAPVEEKPAEKEPVAEKEEAPAEEETPAVETETEVPEEELEEDTTDLKIGAVLIHDENSGYDLAHITGLTTACETLGIDPAQIIFKYNVAEDQACYDACAELADQGCQLVFTDSFGHESYAQQAAMDFADTHFISATGVMASASGLTNFHNMFTKIYEARFVSGIVAGAQLADMLEKGEATEAHIGYVGAFPYAEVVSGYTAFYLGVKAIVPDVVMDVQYTNSWYDPVAEGEAAKALMSRGCVIIGQHADSTGAPAAVQEAYDAGNAVYSVGYNIDMLAVAPDAALTSAANDWAPLYANAIASYMTEGTIPADVVLGHESGAAYITALNPMFNENDAATIEQVWAGIASGEVKIFDTTTFTVGGEEVTSQFALDTDGDFVEDSLEAIVDGQFVESFYRSAPYFTMRIDGITELNNN